MATASGAADQTETGPLRAVLRSRIDRRERLPATLPPVADERELRPKAGSALPILPPQRSPSRTRLVASSTGRFARRRARLAYGGLRL